MPHHTAIKRKRFSTVGLPSRGAICACSLGAALALEQIAEPMGRQQELADAHLLEVCINPIQYTVGRQEIACCQ